MLVVDPRVISFLWGLAIMGCLIVVAWDVLNNNK